MHNYLDAIRKLPLVDGRWRGDCIFCSGKNTLSVTQAGTRLMYHCYRVSCPSKKYTRSVRRPLSSHEITDFFGEDGKGKTTIIREWDIPSHFVPIERYANVFNLVRLYHAEEAYKNGQVDIRYDCKLGRIVFILYAKGMPVDGIGRLFPTDKRNKESKWFRYVGADIPAIYQRGQKKCVIVEDMFSLCAVLNVTDCLALLGTNFTTTHFNALLDYEEIIIMLDPDALYVGAGIQAKLDPFVKTILVFMPDDPKYMTIPTLKGIINGG